MPTRSCIWQNCQGQSCARSVAWLSLALLPCILSVVHARSENSRHSDGRAKREYGSVVLREDDARNQTTVVDEIININVTYGGNDDDVEIPGLDEDGEPIFSGALFTDLPGNPYVLLWLAFSYFVSLTGLLLVLVIWNRRRLKPVDRSEKGESSTHGDRESKSPAWDADWFSRIMQALILKTIVVTAQYLAMALDLGLLQEAFSVQVKDGIIDEPGRLLWRPITPRPIYWCRNVSWLITTSITLILILDFAGRPSTQALSSSKSKAKRRKGKRTVPWELGVYVLALNTCLQLIGTIATLAAWRDFSKWFYWVFGLGVWVLLLRQLWPEGALVVRVANKNKVGPAYFALIRVVFATWSLYPILWAIGDGAATVRWELREVLYVVLDAMSKTAFVAVYLSHAVPSALPGWLLACTSFCFTRLTPSDASEGGTRRSAARSAGSSFRGPGDMQGSE